jgi:hypothetical protein
MAPRKTYRIKKDKCDKHSIPIEIAIVNSNKVMDLLVLAFNSEIVELSEENNILFEQIFEKIFEKIDNANMKQVVKENSRIAISYILNLKKGGANELVLRGKRMKQEKSVIIYALVVLFIGLYLLYTAFDIANKLMNRAHVSSMTEDLKESILTELDGQLSKTENGYMHFLVAWYNALYSNKTYILFFQKISMNIVNSMTTKIMEKLEESYENCSTGNLVTESILSWVIGSKTTQNCVQGDMHQLRLDVIKEVDSVMRGIQADYDHIVQCLNLASVLIVPSFIIIYNQITSEHQMLLENGDDENQMLLENGHSTELTVRRSPRISRRSTVG